MRSRGGGARHPRRLIAVVCAELLLSSRVHAAGVEVLKAFRVGFGSINPLCRAADGYFYGTSPGGGDHGAGSAFRVDPSGNFESLHSFSWSEGSPPTSVLVLGADGALYGTTQGGGSHGLGTVFRIDPQGRFSRLHSFDSSDGRSPDGPLVLGRDGLLYGWTEIGGFNSCGIVFSTDSQGTFRVVHRFDETDPYPTSLMLGADGALYGVTPKVSDVNGTIFRIDSNGAFRTLHTFCNGCLDPAVSPSPGLLQGIDGYLYGTTEGSWNVPGTVFRTDLTGQTVFLHTFQDSNDSPGGLVQGADRTLYGITKQAILSPAPPFGTLFSIDAEGQFRVLHVFGEADGGTPSSLTRSGDGVLYGTTSGTETHGGVLFRVQPNGGFQVLHSFDESEGAAPDAWIVFGADGSVYGSTLRGQGTIFRMDQSSGALTIRSYGVTDGTNPRPSLLAVDGDIVGITANGGEASGRGTVFRVTGQGIFETLHSFSGSDGESPSTLVRGAAGTVYGTTRYGGVLGGFGTVFEMKLGGTFESLHSFDDAGGKWPRGLVVESDGTLHGVTTSGQGTVFRLAPDGAFTTLHAFTGGDGSRPSPLLEGRDGSFYGVALGGGQQGRGTVFRFDADGSFSTVHDFEGAEGCSPDSRTGLVRGDDGSLYGAAAGCGPTGAGVIFRLDGRGAVTGVHALDGNVDGFGPQWMFSTRDGSLYGVTGWGGAHGSGTIFRVFKRTFTVLYSFAANEWLSWASDLPDRPMIEGMDGALYGVLSDDHGVQRIFRLDAAGHLSVLHWLDQDVVGSPAFLLLAGNDGTLYGIGTNNGTFRGGTLFTARPYPVGDVNGDFSLDVTDVFALIDYLFAGALAPVPVLRADANGDGVVDVSDVFYLIQYLYAGGPPPA
jgi:uncharacterized repeat protein (TIGR03803 family)